MLDKTSFIPLYQQIKEHLQDMIDSGKAAPGEALPSEKELIEIYDVSSITVRRALSELRQEGKIHSVRGRATFVAEPKIQRDLTHINGFTEDMLKAGKVPTMHDVKIHTESASAEVAGRLRLLPGADVVVIERIRAVNGIFIALQRSYLPMDIGKKIRINSLRTSSLYAVLKDELNFLLSSAEETIDPIIISPELSVILKCSEKQVGFHLRRITFDQKNEPIEYSDSIVRGDMYTLKISMRDTKGGASPVESRRTWDIHK